MSERLRQYDGDCAYQAHWGRERNRWVAWWRSRLGIGWWMDRLGEEMIVQTREETKHRRIRTVYLSPELSRWYCSCGTIKSVESDDRWKVVRSWYRHRSACEAWVERDRRLATLLAELESEHG